MVDALTDRCIFLTTPFRSGSSFLSRILSAHPSISMSYDTVNFFRFCYGKYGPFEDSAVAQRRLFEDMAKRLYGRFDLTLDVEGCLRHFRSGESSYGQAFLSILRTLFPNPEKTILGDKEPLAWTRIPTFLDMFPNGKAIVIVRDPRDVVVSFKKMTIAPEPDYLIALFNVIDCVNKGLQFQAAWPERVRVVQFEHLKADMQSQVRALCDWLEVDLHTDDMLNAEKFTDHKGEAWVSEAASIFPPSQPPVGRWRYKIDPADLLLCEWIAEYQIRRMGLSFSGAMFQPNLLIAGLRQIHSSPLLFSAFTEWLNTGDGCERFPLDPLDPKTWVDAMAHPEVFEK